MGYWAGIGYGLSAILGVVSVWGIISCQYYKLVVFVTNFAIVPVVMMACYFISLGFAALYDPKEPWHGRAFGVGIGIFMGVLVGSIIISSIIIYCANRWKRAKQHAELLHATSELDGSGIHKDVIIINGTDQLPTDGYTVGSAYEPCKDCPTVSGTMIENPEQCENVTQNPVDNKSDSIV
jgi:uncharacterized membrane protein (DUF485 family)